MAKHAASGLISIEETKDGRRPSEPNFQDDGKARDWLEARIWANGRYCPHCGAVEARTRKLEGKAHRPGVYQCNDCREQFTARGASLSESDRDILRQALGEVREIGARQDVIREGDRPDNVHVILERFACRYKILPDGSRQMMAFLVPGDACDLHVAILREWLVGMGRRPADKRLAHLFCELLMRLQAVEQATATSFDLPLTQAELANAIGLSTVHVNRTLQALREEGLITLAGKRLTILDPEGLKAFAEFDPGYLHLDKRSRQPAAA